MKQILTIITLFFICNITKAQNENVFTNALNISIGRSTPRADLSKTNINDSSSGYAKNGGAFIFAYEYTMNNGFGFYAQFKSAVMNINETKLTADAEAKLGAGWKKTQMTTTGYHFNALNFGVLYTINKNHKFQIIPSLGFGFTACRNRGLDATFQNGFFTTRYNFKDDNKSAMNINYGLDFSYRISSKLSIILKFNGQVQAPNYAVNRQWYVNNILLKGENKNEVSPALFNTNTIGIRYRL